MTHGAANNRGPLSARAARPEAGMATRSDVWLLPTVHATLLRLGLLAGEAQKLIWELHIRSYEHELLRRSPPGAYSHRPGPQSSFAASRGHFDRKAKCLNMLANEFGTLVEKLLENLQPRVEAYPGGPAASQGELPKNLKDQLEEYERELVLWALQASGMNQVLAAKVLRILPTTLNEKMKRLGLRSPRRHRAEPLSVTSAQGPP